MFADQIAPARLGELQDKESGDDQPERQETDGAR